MTQAEATERLAEMQAMRAEGSTFEAIGHAFGLSKQRVYQIMRRGDTEHKRSMNKNRPASVYVNLEAWALAHNCTWSELADECDQQPSLFYRNFVHGIAENPGKRSIDRLLQITGLTYEQLFERELTQ